MYIYIFQTQLTSNAGHTTGYETL